VKEVKSGPRVAGGNVLAELSLLSTTFSSEARPERAAESLVRAEVATSSSLVFLFEQLLDQKGTRHLCRGAGTIALAMAEVIAWVVDETRESSSAGEVGGESWIKEVEAASKAKVNKGRERRERVNLGGGPASAESCPL
jgi:hypothetical protein